MKKTGLKKVHLFTISLLISLLHLAVGFAKPKSRTAVTVPSEVKSVADTSPTQNATAGMEGLYDSLRLGSLGLARQAFDYALRGFRQIEAGGRGFNRQVLSIADFTLSSSQKRLFIIDLTKRKLLFNTYVAHGMNSGKEYAQQFSNVPESNKSSLGFYRTADTYIGKHGYSLHLDGLEKGVNDNANRRDIVVHGADYVSEDLIRSQGFIGRSQGCPALPGKLSRPIIEQIKNGTCLFIFGSDRRYAGRSSVLRPVLAHI